MAFGRILLDQATRQGPAAAESADKIFANISRQQYDDFIKNFGGFEDTLISRSQNDTSLVDQAKLDTTKATAITKGVADRNASRYGIGLMPDQLKARDGALQRQSALGGSDAINNARVAQKDLNNNLLDGLIDVGNGVQQAAMGQLSTAATSEVSRKNAYTQAKAQSQANTWSTIGTLGAMAAFAF